MLCRCEYERKNKRTMSFLQHIKPSVQKLETYTVKGKPLSPELIKLNQNENPFDLPDELKRELIEDFYHQPWNRYPEVFPTHLLEALSKHLSLPIESIIAANGSNELMYTIGMAIIGKGTKVLIPMPTFFLYEKIVRVLEGEVIEVPMKQDLSFDVDAIIGNAKKEKPALIILNSPNSPTGQSILISDVERILRETDSIVLVDEAYIEFSDKPSAATILFQYDRLIILRTFSKAFSLAGLRIGYLLAQPALVSELLKPKIPFTVNNFSASIAIKLMQNNDMVTERIRYIIQQRAYLHKNLSEQNGITLFCSDSNFLIFKSKNEAAVLLEQLLNENVLIRDVSSYPMLKGFLRVNAGTEFENNAFLTALKKYL